MHQRAREQINIRRRAALSPRRLHAHRTQIKALCVREIFLIKLQMANSTCCRRVSFWCWTWTRPTSTPATTAGRRTDSRTRRSSAPYLAKLQSQVRIYECTCEWETRRLICFHCALRRASVTRESENGWMVLEQLAESSKRQFDGVALCEYGMADGTLPLFPLLQPCSEFLTVNERTPNGPFCAFVPSLLFKCSTYILHQQT